MQSNWRTILGPALTMATALSAFAVDRHFAAVPNPAPLFVCIVALASSIGGTASGLLSAAIAVAGSAVFFLNHRATPGYDFSDLARMAMLAATAAVTAVITGVLRRKWIDAFAWEQKHHATAERLKAALDQVDIGIVLLDSDTRAEFINRAFRDYFALTDEQAESKPPFIALMYHGRDTGAYELPKHELNEFIARRIEMMRIGDSTPIDINLADGKVLRFSCTALPDGGRMLSYTPVTDLVRRTDDPKKADYYRSLRGIGRALDRGLGSALRAAE
ncbi:PAS-domain containing protein [Bradyrhizobium sp. Ai1a-2]|uniref:PAS domain-containing protein n=1 Tax=Bradyrhizobium sp. Ai1a-2 TaxID=196490 RepID=UPI00040B5BEB|nr:PAS-domain containing protein [Bradyrhizobium sp. Ai1a-2]